MSLFLIDNTGIDIRKKKNIHYRRCIDFNGFVELCRAMDNLCKPKVLPRNSIAFSIQVDQLYGRFFPQMSSVLSYILAHLYFTCHQHLETREEEAMASVPPYAHIKRSKLHVIHFSRL